MRISIFQLLLLENEAYSIFEQHILLSFLCSSKFLSFPHDLTLPIVGSTFQMTGRHDLIGSSRSVEIFAAALGNSTSGSKAYFLFKLHDPTSGESGRQQQLTTRLSSCILDMCEDENNQVNVALVIEKSRVAPTKVTTIPRLELTAALVSAKVGTKIREELCYSNLTEFFWTDSKVVLGYIKNEAKRFHTFVATNAAVM